MDALADRINALLPQTQCTRCGYPDCAGYARAIADGSAKINQCPPGGAEGILRLSRLTRQPAMPLNPAHGVEVPRSVAVIDEAWCIGCTLCIAACPTDAIIGSNKLMHTVIEPYCTGCELCVPACPVDCIGMENVTLARTGWAAWSQVQADEALKRYKFHNVRRNRDENEVHKVGGQKTVAKLPNRPAQPSDTDVQALDRKRVAIATALARARARHTPDSSDGG